MRLCSYGGSGQRFLQWPHRALLPSFPKQAIAVLPGLHGKKEEQCGDPAISLQGSECPSVREIRNGAEVTMKLPVPAASRQWRLYPISGTALFPARLHLLFSFQAGAEPCCFLLVDFLVSLLSLLMSHGHPQRGGLLWTLTHRVPVLYQAPHHRDHKGVANSNTSGTLKLPCRIFSILHTPWCFPLLVSS